MTRGAIVYKAEKLAEGETSNTSSFRQFENVEDLLTLPRVNREIDSSLTKNPLDGKESRSILASNVANPRGITN